MLQNVQRFNGIVIWFAATVLFLATDAVQSVAQSTLTLRTRQPGAELTHNRIKLEVGGDLRTRGDAKPLVQPMSVVAQFTYDERRIDDGTVPTERRSIRHYDSAQAAIKVNNHASLSKLPDDRRLIRAAVSNGQTSLRAVRGHLTREQQDLIDLPGNTLLLEDLLPETTATPETKTKPADTLLAMLLGLDAISRNDIKIAVASTKLGEGELTIEGTASGAIGGVATEIELKGKLTYDPKLHRPQRLTLLIKEKRSIGHASPGLDVVAKLTVERSIIQESAELSDKALQDLELAADGTRPPLLYTAPTGGFSMHYDPRWSITNETADTVVLRFVDRGELVAQCNASLLPRLAKDKVITLEQFQDGVKTSLGKNFGQFERAGERQREDGIRVLRAVASGAVSDLAITWHYYLLIDPNGRRAAISFTLESSLAPQFAEADHALIDSFTIAETPAVEKNAEAEAKSTAGTKR